MLRAEIFSVQRYTQGCEVGARKVATRVQQILV
jgi:hypothetical protein